MKQCPQWPNGLCVPPPPDDDPTQKCAQMAEICPNLVQPASRFRGSLFESTDSNVTLDAVPPDIPMASVQLSWSPPMRLVRRCAPALLLFLGPATVRADSPVTTVPPLPPALAKLAPETLDDLKAIQEQTKAVLKKVMACTVGLQVRGASGSG